MEVPVVNHRPVPANFGDEAMGHVTGLGIMVSILYPG
jgi:hypothetical protein